MRLRPVGLSALLLVSAISSVPVLAQTPASWRDSYDAKDVMISMRDGTKLYTVYFIPKGKTGPFPILMERTPYGAGNPNSAPRRTTPKINASRGYILAFQDVRGKGKSEGDFENVRPTLKKGAPGCDESTDTYDTVEYLIKNLPSNSGRVGLWGISYPGFYAGAGAIRNHPALKAVSPQAPVNDWFLGDDVHHRGALFLQESFDFSLGFDVPRGKPGISVDREGLAAYDFYLKAGALSNFESKFLQGRLPYWTELMENETYNEYWKSRALWRSFKDVNCAVLTVGGWFDKEDMWGALNLYGASERQNKKSANFLVMGPWSHGQWSSGNAASLGDLAWGDRTGQWYQENVEFPFFERYLRGDDSVASVAEATMFETGVNKWQRFEEWPPKGMQNWNVYLGAGKTLSTAKPTTEGSDSYVADPAKPTPYVADYTTSRRTPGDWLIHDQTFATTRSDVLTYQGITFDKDVRVAGPIDADFWITTTGTDMDLVVKVIDQYPSDSPEVSPTGKSLANYQLMVRGEILRGKFRNSWEKPEPFVPGKPTRVRLQLNDVLHTFRKGHKLVVQVQSYWFPVADRNPNQFLSIAKAKDRDFIKATIGVLYGPKTPSTIRFGTLK
ncbi:MAG: CocE/NonD family hydrolase [Fimbriimonas sp.]